ncbi:hypothetical protein [Bradyrhizobium sp. SEMIA]|uniref:hypothetical protein n=1 Tax=Bradyrhizobium sp. SEMIA TaxID=2597515 RepID=UPI0018A54FAF|nr:hypothetical protein [Bradyrhizobium sp. SEMIA]QOG23355.1 hypothetical protein FOM02_45045 [Bradyrhizobium sp. SEMIA]
MAQLEKTSCKINDRIVSLNQRLYRERRGAPFIFALERAQQLRSLGCLMRAEEAALHLEMPAKQLILQEANSAISSKCALKSLNNQTDFDSAIRRFDPSPPPPPQPFDVAREIAFSAISFGNWVVRCPSKRTPLSLEIPCYSPASYPLRPQPQGVTDDADRRQCHRGRRHDRRQQKANAG